MGSNDILYALEEILYFLSTAELTLDTILTVIGMIISLGQVVLTVVGWGVALASVVLAAVMKVVVFIVKAIPVFALAKKNGRKLAWLAWMPFFTDYLQTMVLMDTPGDVPFKLFNGKLTIKRRWISYAIWLGVLLIAPKLIGAIRAPIVAAVGVVPVVGVLVGSLISFVLNYTVKGALGILEFGYLRDVLNVYNADKKNNQTMAIVIVVLDWLVTGGWAQTIWLYLQLKKKPLPVQEVEAEVAA